MIKKEVDIFKKKKKKKITKNQFPVSILSKSISNRYWSDRIPVPVGPIRFDIDFSKILAWFTMETA